MSKTKKKKKMKADYLIKKKQSQISLIQGF